MEERDHVERKVVRMSSRVELESGVWVVRRVAVVAVDVRVVDIVG